MLTLDKQWAYYRSSSPLLVDGKGYYPTKKEIKMIQRFEPNGIRLSHVLVHNGIAYVTGQTPVDRSQDIVGRN